MVTIDLTCPEKNLLFSRGNVSMIVFFFPCELTRMKEFFLVFGPLEVNISCLTMIIDMICDESWNLHYLP